MIKLPTYEKKQCKTICIARLFFMCLAYPKVWHLSNSLLKLSLFFKKMMLDFSL